MRYDKFEQKEKSAGIIYWDKRFNLRDNIRANLFRDGVILQEYVEDVINKDKAVGGYSIADELNLVNLSAFSYTKAERDIALKLLQRLDAAEMMVVEGQDELRSDNSYFIEIEKFLTDLPSHSHGKPSLLYAILKNAMQESTNLHANRLNDLDEEVKKESEKATQQREGLLKSEADLSASMKTERDLQKKSEEVKKEVVGFREKEDKLLEKEKRLREHLKLVKDNIAKLQKTVAELEKKEKKPVTAQESINHRGAYSKGLKKRIESQEADKAAASERKEEKKKNLEEVRREKENLTQVIDRVRSCLYSISAVGSLNYPTDRKHETDKLGTFARMIKDLWRKKLTVPEPSHEETTSSEVEHEEEWDAEDKRSQMVTIDSGDDKSFDWDLAQGICGNMERLMDGYLKSPGYHSPDRVKSAKKILEEIQLIRNNGELKDEKSRDIALMRIIREQNVGSHGFNRKKSVLHRIYHEAELRYRDAVKNDVEEKVKDLRGLKKESESLSKSGRRAKKSLQSSENRSQNLQERIGIYLSQREELKEKIEKQKQQNVKLKKALKAGREILLTKQGEVLALSVQANSSQRTLQAEANFVNEHLALLVNSNELVEDNEALQDEVAEMDDECKKTEAQNQADTGNILRAYTEMHILSKKCEGVEMAEVEDIADINAVAKSLEDFASALEEKAQYVVSDSSSEEELSSDLESGPSKGSEGESDWNPFV